MDAECKTLWMGDIQMHWDEAFICSLFAATGTCRDGRSGLDEFFSLFFVFSLFFSFLCVCVFLCMGLLTKAWVETMAMSEA